MDARKLKATFQKVLEEAALDYAVVNTDVYGDCGTCVNATLAARLGADSKGIFLKHWTKGMNAGGPLKALTEAYIAHDLTDAQAETVCAIFKREGYKITPEAYDPRVCFVICEADSE